jgi:hypothetical protein
MVGSVKIMQKKGSYTRQQSTTIVSVKAFGQLFGHMIFNPMRHRSRYGVMTLSHASESVVTPWLAALESGT